MHNAPRGPKGPELKSRTQQLRVPTEHYAEISALAKRLGKPTADAFEIWLRERGRSRSNADVVAQGVHEYLQDLGVPPKKAGIVGLCTKALLTWATTEAREERLYQAITGFIDSCHREAR